MIQPPAQNNPSIRTVILNRKGGLILSALCASLGAAMGLVPYIVVYLVALEIFNRPPEQVNQGTILTLAVVALGASIVKALCMVGSEYVSHITAYRILYDLRMALARKLGTLPPGYFNQRSTGTIKKVIHEDCEQMEIGLAHVTPDVVAGVSVTVITTIALFIIDWRMALATVVVAPIAIALFFVSLKRIGGYGEFEQLSAQMNAAVIQYVNGMKVIKAFTQTTARFAKLRGVIDEMRTLYLRIVDKLGLSYQALFVLLRMGALLLVVPTGLLLYLDGSLDLPTYLFFIVIALVFNRPIFNVFFHGATAFYQIGWASGRVTDIFNEPGLAEPHQPQTPQDYTITFQNVVFRYDAAPIPEPAQASNKQPEPAATHPHNVLDGISLTVPAGTVTALVGPSGAGKTTIARLIPRFWEVTDGAICIGGVDLRDMAVEALMDQVAFVFQDVYLFNDTIAENIRVGKPDASEAEIIEAAKLARCHDFIMAFPEGYQYQVGENGQRLSGGQKQRLSIARAILKNAPIIVLDEATAFVDPENESQIQAAIAELLQRDPLHPKTLVIVAHRLSTITEADQILVIDEGQIAAQGTHADLLAHSPLYGRMWQAYTDAQQWQFAHAPRQAGTQAAPASAHATPVTPPPAVSEIPAFTPQYTDLHDDTNIITTIARLIPPHYRPRLPRLIVWKALEGITVAWPNLLVVALLILLLQSPVNTTLVWWCVGALGLTFVLQLVFGTLSFRENMLMDLEIQQGLRLYLADYLRRLPLGFFTRRDAGTIDGLFTTTLMYLETRTVLSALMGALLAPTLLFLFMLTQDWRLALALAISVVPFGLVLSRFLHVFREVWHAQSMARTRANSRMVEYIQGITIIRAFNLSGARFGQFERALEDYRQASTRTITRTVPMIVAPAAVLELGFALFLVLGAVFYANGTLTMPIFLLFLVLGAGFYVPFMALADMLAQVRVVQNSVRNINAFLQTPTLPEPAQPQQPQGFAIEFQEMSFDYGSELATDPAARRVLDRISFRIPERSFTALVGPSGSGKTTITNLIARFWDVTNGEVRLGGVPVQTIATDDLLARMTMVFQDVYLFNDTIFNNIKIGNPVASEEAVIAAARAARCHDFIQAMPDGYNTLVGEGGATLSGGQKQRISIARAILKDAPIVLLDEATAAIDPENEALIQQAFDALVRHKTLVVIAHRLTTVQHADQILVLDEGRLVQRGTHDDLITQAGLYRRFWEERQKARSWKIAGDLLIE
jgi:ATP-binding cassette subfamily B protein